MKYSKKILLGSLLWAVANGVYASAANLHVAGTLLPTSCIPSFSAGGVYDLGTGSIKSFSLTEVNRLPERDFTYSIDCDAPIAVSYRVLDNRADTIAGSPNAFFSYGMGRQGTAGIGFVSVYQLAGARVDGQPATMLISNDAGGTWGVAGPIHLIASENHLSFTNSGGSAPQAFSRYEGALRMAPRIVPLSRLDVDEEIVVDGSMTMEVVYL